MPQKKHGVDSGSLALLPDQRYEKYIDRAEVKQGNMKAKPK
jgi:hypothetical protein